MLKSKKFIGIAVAAMIAAIMALSVAAASNAGQIGAKTKESAEAAGISSPDSAKLRTAAQDLGIDTTGLTDDQIQAAIDSAKPQDRETSVDGVKAFLNEQGLDTTGMTEDQIYAAARSAKENIAREQPQNGQSKVPADRQPPAADLKDFLARQGVDTAGMTDAQLNQAALACKILMGYNRNGSYAREEKDAISRELGIDTSGLTDAQITAVLQAQLNPAA